MQIKVYIRLKTEKLGWVAEIEEDEINSKIPFWKITRIRKSGDKETHWIARDEISTIQLVQETISV